MPAVPTLPVWANNAGEFIRRYSPDTTCATDRRPGSVDHVSLVYNNCIIQQVVALM